MADYYTHVSMGFKATPEQWKWLDGILTEVSQRLSEHHESVGDDTYSEQAYDDALSEEATELWGVVKESESWGLEASYDESLGGVWVRDEAGGPNLDALAKMLAMFLREYGEIDDELHFTWAETCSRPRLDSFGGGACVVTLQTTEWMNTTQWLRNLEHEPREEDQLREET